MVWKVWRERSGTMSICLPHGARGDKEILRISQPSWTYIYIVISIMNVIMDVSHLAIHYDLYIYNIVIWCYFSWTYHTSHDDHDDSRHCVHYIIAIPMIYHWWQYHDITYLWTISHSCIYHSFSPENDSYYSLHIIYQNY